MSASPELTPRERILRAGLDLFGSQGFAATTIRQIAASASVSIGLVHHHFGSKEGLREACDAWVLETIASEKELVTVAGGPSIEAGRYLEEHPEFVPVMAYLTRTLRDGGQAADAIFDRLVNVTQDMMETGIEVGTFRRVDDIPGTAAVLTAYSLGASLMSAQLAKHLGGSDLLDRGVYTNYARISLDMFVSGVLTAGWVQPGPESEAGPRSGD